MSGDWRYHRQSYVSQIASNRSRADTPFTRAVIFLSRIAALGTRITPACFDTLSHLRTQACGRNDEPIHDPLGPSKMAHGRISWQAHDGWSVGRRLPRVHTSGAATASGSVHAVPACASGAGGGWIAGDRNGSVDLHRDDAARRRHYGVAARLGRRSVRIGDIEAGPAVTGAATVPCERTADCCLP